MIKESVESYKGRENLERNESLGEMLLNNLI